MDSSKSMQDNVWLSDFHYASRISFYLLKPVGIWPLEQQTTMLKIITRGLSVAITTFLLLFMIIPWIISMITERWSLNEIIRIACPLIYTTTVFLRYLLLLFHRDEIKSCINHIAEDWRNAMIAEDREIMLENAKMGRFFGITSTIFMFSSGVIYCILPVTIPIVVTEDNKTIRSLQNPCELLILDVQVSPVYETVYAMLCLGCYVLYTVFCGICSLTAKFVSHACGQCEILTYFLKELLDGGDRTRGSTLDERIGIIIQRHLRILRFIFDVNKTLNEICLAEFINSSCNICLLGYYLLMDWNNRESMLQISLYFIAFISIIFNIYMFCYIGEQLVDRYQKIGTTCYMIEWYRLPENKARNLIFPIIMSNYSVELTAGKMLTMTMSSFSSILKISMGYFNLIRQVSTKEVM